MNTGDKVYKGGLDNEYIRYFFPVYNAQIPDPQIGAPLLRSIPFYCVIANHDVHNKDKLGNPVADFDADPDSLAYYTNFYLPERTVLCLPAQLLSVGTGVASRHSKPALASGSRKWRTTPSIGVALTFSALIRICKLIRQMSAFRNG